MLSGDAPHHVVTYVVVNNNVDRIALHVWHFREDPCKNYVVYSCLLSWSGLLRLYCRMHAHVRCGLLYTDVPSKSALQKLEQVYYDKQTLKY